MYTNKVLLLCTMAKRVISKYAKIEATRQRQKQISVKLFSADYFEIAKIAASAGMSPTSFATKIVEDSIAKPFASGGDVEFSAPTIKDAASQPGYTSWFNNEKDLRVSIPIDSSHNPFGIGNVCWNDGTNDVRWIRKDGKKIPIKGS